MLLHLRMRSVQRVPGPAAPPAKGDLIGGKRLSHFVLYEPLRMLLEYTRTRLSNERSHPDCRLKPSRPDRFQYTLQVAAESLASVQPIAHGRLVAVVNLHVAQ